MSWSDIKSFVDTRGVPLQYITINNSYMLFAFDGPLGASAQILLDGTDSTNQTDFETNYQPSANQPLQPIVSVVTTQFEKRDKTLKIAHGENTVSEDGTVTVLLKIPGTPGSGDGRWISGGTAFFDVHTPGDKIIGIYFTDEDNILGGGAGAVVGSYTDDDADEQNRGWAVRPSGVVEASSIGGYGFAPSGFYIKIIGFKAGVSPSGKLYCNFEWAKSDG